MQSTGEIVTLSVYHYPCGYLVSDAEILEQNDSFSSF